MGKFQLRKPRIISKNFPEVGSHIDNVSKSLHDVVFSYSEKVDKALQKKHMMMAFSTLVLILVVGSFISPHGKADIATFYPETCLGGWLNPKNGEGEPETTSNADPSQFDDKNSAILDKNTSADIYCGNYTGTFNDATVPKKIIISLAMTNKGEITVGTTTPPLESFVDIATSTSIEDASSSLQLASSTEVSLSENAPSSLTATTSADISTTTNQEVTTASTSTTETSSFVDIIINAVSDTVSNIFNPNLPSGGDTDTVVVPQPVDTTISAPQQTESAPPSPPPAAEESSPTSYLNTMFKSLISSLTSKAFAEETPQGEGTQVTPPLDEQSPLKETGVPKDSESMHNEVSSTTEELLVASSTVNDTASSSSATTTEDTLFASSTTATSTATSTLQTEGEQVVSSTTEEVTDTQNNFLEVFYTFDGMTWTSLGELNEISMKYRTFEIPLSASSTWSDMSQLQIKVTTKSLLRETPVTYLDGIKVEVLYDSTLEYSHPDFTRDTILKDETVDGMRLVTIINNETNEEETWYMYLEDASSTSESPLHITSSTSSPALSLDNATSSVTSTTVEPDSLLLATTTKEVASSTVSTSTEMTATTTQKIVPVIPKNKWFKLEKKDTWVGLSAKELVEEIKKDDKEKLEERESEEKEKEKEDRVPDFAKDIIKKIKGALFSAIIVQVEKEGKEELWLYDLESKTQQKIEAGSSTSITLAKDMQLGLKDSFIFWVSEDKRNVYAYNIVDKTIQFVEIPPYDSSLGERGRVRFEGIPWDVIIGSEDFAFYSEATGEVFSDDNGSLSEALRQRFELDKVLDVNTISGLNLSITATTTEE